MSAVLAGAAAGGATAVVGFLHFATWFGHGGLQFLAKGQQEFDFGLKATPQSIRLDRLLGSGIGLLQTGEFFRVR